VERTARFRTAALVEWTHRVRVMRLSLTQSRRLTRRLSAAQKFIYHVREGKPLTIEGHGRRSKP